MVGCLEHISLEFLEGGDIRHHRNLEEGSLVVGILWQEEGSLVGEGDSLLRRGDSHQEEVDTFVLNKAQGKHSWLSCGHGNLGNGPRTSGSRYAKLAQTNRQRVDDE